MLRNQAPKPSDRPAQTRRRIPSGRPGAEVLSVPMPIQRLWTTAPPGLRPSLTIQPKKVGTVRSCSWAQRASASLSGFGSHSKPDPIWVDTHKGIPNLVAENKPTKPCKVCLGHGKVVCGTCDGKGDPLLTTPATVAATRTT